VFIGYQAGYSETGSDKLYVDNSNTTTPLIYGDFSADEIIVNGSLGVGTSPSYKLDVSGGQARIEISTQYSERLCHSGSDGSSTQQVILGDCSGGGADIAEYYGTHDASLEAGDVVKISSFEEDKPFIAKTNTSYEKTLLGVVSTDPYDIFGDVYLDRDNAKPIALAGRVPTKVSTENGPIRIGDLLTSSRTAGVAMKATEPGLIIGMALENFDRPGVGKIKVFVNLSWYGFGGGTMPVNQLTQFDLAGNLNMNGRRILNVSKIVAQNEVWSIDENGVLKVKVTNNGTSKEMFGLISAKVEMALSGSDELNNGEKIINLNTVDPDFVKNISQNTPLKVLVTLTGRANGIYVAEKTSTSFKVKELNNGASSASFDWLVIARRKGYEDAVSSALSVSLPVSEPPDSSEPTP